MIIANPIFDVVFKRLMENNRVARFFVETLIEESVTELTPIPQEYTYYKGKIVRKRKKKLPDNPEDYEVLSVIRFDFVATILTAAGEHKKVLIEIQKSQNATDLMRFRTYLGEQYKRTDEVEKDGKKTRDILPIISIYLLGFKLTETNAIAIKVSRTYNDLITRKELHVKSPLIECLTHDSYVVQIPRISGKTRTHLEQMLTVFEQKYFIDEKGILKEYNHDVDDRGEMGEMIGILRHTAADPKEKRDMEEEWWAYMRDMEMEEKLKEAEIRSKEAEAKLMEAEAKSKELEAKSKEAEAKSKELEAKSKEAEAKSKKLESKSKKTEAKSKKLEEIAQKQAGELKEKDKKLDEFASENKKMQAMMEAMMKEIELLKKKI